MRVTSPRRPWTTDITVQAESGIRGVVVGGRRFDLASLPLEQRTRWSLSYVALPEQGGEVTLELMPNERVTLHVTDTAHGLPEIPGKTFRARPADAMPASVDMTDASLVTKTFQY